MLRIVTAVAVASGLLPAAEAIVFPPNSPCSGLCGNLGGSIANDDIVCDQNAYSTSNTAQVFSGCLDCELSTGYSFGTQSDVSAAMCRWNLL